MKRLFIIASMAALVAVSAVYFTYFSQSETRMDTTESNRELPGILYTAAPWPANQDLLRERLAAIGMPALREEGSASHTHQHLDLFVHGQAIAIPADIGVGVGEEFFSPMHTHDTLSIIHVESPTMRRFTLGQFFDVWGVRFDQQCLGGYCVDTDNQLRVYQNGRLVSGNVRDVVLTAHDEIAVIFGLASELPNPIPASYNFPAGQ